LTIQFQFHLSIISDISVSIRWICCQSY
jgi:hypothetical protein